MADMGMTTISASNDMRQTSGNKQIVLCSCTAALGQADGKREYPWHMFFIQIHFDICVLIRSTGERNNGMNDMVTQLTEILRNNCDVQ